MEVPRTQEDESVPTTPIGWIVLIFVTLWIIAGLAAFVMSILCFAYSGSVIEKIGGFAISILFGPFYWIYYAFMSNYCKANGFPSPKSPSPSPSPRKRSARK